MDLQDWNAPRKRELRHTSRSEQPLTPFITAQLTGSHHCEALGIVAKGRAPALALCRQLLVAGIDPDTALVVVRNGILSLRIRSIREGARLTVEDGETGIPKFRLVRPARRGAALLVPKKATGVS
jgi:hypothetical protein